MILLTKQAQHLQIQVYAWLNVGTAVQFYSFNFQFMFHRIQIENYKTMSSHLFLYYWLF